MHWFEIVAAQIARGEPSLVEKVVPPIAGAFCGASAAFLLGFIQRTRERKLQRYEAVLATQSALASQGNTLLTVQKNAARPDVTNPFDNLKKFFNPFTSQRIAFGPLAFVGSLDDPHLLMVLDLAQQSYMQFVELNELRNILVEKCLFDRDAILRLDADAQTVAAKNIDRIVQETRAVSSGTWDSLKKAIAENAAARERLRNFGVRHFKRWAILVELPTPVEPGQLDMKTDI